MKTKEINVPRNAKGWSFIDGELREVTIREVWCNYDKETDEFVTTKYLVDSGERNKYRYVSDDNLYEDENGFRTGTPTSYREESFASNIKHLSYLEENLYGYWCMENGEPVWHTMRISEIVWSFVTNKLFIQGFPTPNVYVTREECLRWNEYVVAYEDGRKETRKGACALVQLTEEQKKAVKSVERAFQKARNLGVAFFSLYDECYVANVSEFENWDCASIYEKSFFEEQDMKERVELSAMARYGCEKLSPFSVGEECVLFFKRK